MVKVGQAKMRFRVKTIRKTGRAKIFHVKARIGKVTPRPRFQGKKLVRVTLTLTR